MLRILKREMLENHIKMIFFNVPSITGNEIKYIEQAILINKQISGDGPFTLKCSNWMNDKFKVPKALLTTSGTHALEMAAILVDIKPGDEVIMPSFTFVSTANAFLLHGALPVFVDIRSDTLNINEKLIEAAITSKTKAICVVHYAGVACEMDSICAIAKRYGLLLIEDAAHAFMSKYKGKYLGTIGEYGAYSFHETKNYSMGEGGALVFQAASDIERAEIIREKGTNRSRYFRGEIDKYTWVDVGSSYLPSDINAAYLFAQLEQADKIFDDRMKSWSMYHQALEPLQTSGYIERPYIPEECEHNAHMYYIKCADLVERTRLISYLKSKGIESAFHYVPLHSSDAGLKFGRFSGDDTVTTRESERLVRLPMCYGLKEDDLLTVVQAVETYYLS
jgi:dTDP-4-amino-4,6-dideoxygalactose transaminase